METSSVTRNQARQLVAAGQMAEAEAIYRQLLIATPQAAELWHELGVVLLRFDRPQDALDCLQQAVSLDPGTSAYHSNLGLAYRMLKQPEQAVASFEEAIKLGTPAAELLNNLALARKDLEQFDAALEAFDRAVALRPDYANGYFNRGNLLLDVGRLEAAADDYRRTIGLNPRDAGAHFKLGVAYRDLGDLDQAVASFEQALAIQPDYPEARRNRGLVWLLEGNDAQGWPEFEYRFACEGAVTRHYEQPRWDGSPLSGRTLLVWADQGLGDTLQFVRFLPALQKLGGKVLLDAHPSLARLLEQSGYGDLLVWPGAALAFDVHCPLMSLPATRPELQREPYWHGPYLQADAALVEQWRGVIRQSPDFTVGIAWAGNPAQSYNRFRSFSLEHFLPIARTPGVRLFSLQKGEAAGQIAALAGQLEVEDLGPRLHDFADTAAVMKNLDLVISVDSSPAHVAGGLGVPVWIPVITCPDWRWRGSESHSPWYPSVRLFRQQRFDDWPPVFVAMAAALPEQIAKAAASRT